MKFKVADLLSFKKKSVKPEPGVQYHVYSLPGFDNRQTPEFLMGEDIKSTKYAVQPKTILMNKLNVGFKRVWLIDQPLDNSIASTEFIPLSVSSKDELNLQYMYYFLTSREVTEVLKKASTGTSNSHQRINADLIADLDIDLPSLREQKLIADKLATLDSKITLNQEINDNLLELLSVQQRQLIQSRPTSLKSISMLATKTMSGGTPSRKVDSYWLDGTIPWLKTKEIGDIVASFPEEFITEFGLENSAAKMMPANSVVVAMYGNTSGEVSWLPFESTMNQATYSIDSSVNEYLYVYLRNAKQELHNMATGSAQQNLSKKVLDAYEIPVPDDEHLDRFSRLAKPVMLKIGQNAKQIQTLVSLRDRLLETLLG
ncbi:restriction endonuclease subunit S [Weissella paramesenteroides]|uniref:restriction endonuclease subunit S n=1 Tax=Weissella paramesenteroides TaxID=1249 RepID=UPI003F260072